ncbi:alkaline phosphatase [Dyadobacter sp. CY356]|uniref:alkaline phosphatase n=1 Tax=Dyadobacter sp. CY356 TaxID=2906442 RepID=UPI001F1FDD49|nr:alkaline phosphatase [Dyadobacter sp. CY356]
MLSYTTAQAHSHNDNRQLKPFREASDQQFGSVETDLMLKNGKLYSVNHLEDTTPERTFEKMYLLPMIAQLEKNNGQIYSQNDITFQFLIDIKTKAVETLDILVKELEKHPEIIAPGSNIKIVVSGNIPVPELFFQYPQYISFDGNPDIIYTPQQLERVALISQSFSKYTSWNGEGPLPKNDKKLISRVVQKTHGLNKKIRFWDTPDNINTWKTMMALQVDFLDTGKVIQMGDYLRTAPR